MEFPNLETSRLTLTMLVEDDAHDIFQLFSNDTVIEYYDLEAFNHLLQATNLIKFFQTRFNENNGIRWAIRLKESNKLIGTCGFNSWNKQMKNAVIGYDLLPQFWSKGYTTEAVRRIITAAFSEILPCGKLNRIQADTVPGNIASEQLLLKVGFKAEGIRRQSGYWKNQFHDLKCFALLQSDCY